MFLQGFTIDSEKGFQNLLDSFPLSILLLDLNKKIYYYNKATELYLHQTSDNLLKKSFVDIFRTPDKLKIEEIINNVISFDFSEVSEFEFIDDKGSKNWIELVFSLIKIKKNKFVQIILHDITERKIAEKIIKDENRRLKELNSIKKDMTAKTSEQLKTPLSIIVNSSEILTRSYKDLLDQDALNLLTLIKDYSEKSLNLVGKIINISEIESDDLTLNKQFENLTSILITAINSIKNDNGKYVNIFNLDINEDLYSNIDELRMKKAFKELLFDLLKNNNTKEIKIITRANNKIGEIQIKCQLEQSRFPFIPRISSFSKKIFKLHGGEILIDERNPHELGIIIQIPIKEWRDNLISLFIICKSGIPLLSHSFEKTEKYKDTPLISGGIIGLMTILKAILQGSTHIKSIDHGDRTVIFDLNKTKEIVFVLIVKENITIYESKLALLIQEFDRIYEESIQNIDDTSNDSENWQDIELLIEKFFLK